ncbi:hypothetical protein [Anaeromyxobacter terrae]|uniref:hypothetical protein n=1 Tax=Anaeromyxobacter terrae TaxID=2925406 RepID=UPI001F5A49A7|nr:hypothetical protein [Anaeromyxobacter sp. SG22]
MPKRLLDDSFLSSPSIAAVSPRAQDAFPRFILLADDFGCFDANPRVLLGKGWPYREDVTADDVAAWLDEYELAGMALLWDEAGRRWCYLTGWHGVHGQKPRDEYHHEKAPRGSKRKTPRPPGWDPVTRTTWRARDSAAAPSTEMASDSVPARETSGNEPGAASFPVTQLQPQPQLQSKFQAQAQSQPQPTRARAAELGPMGADYRACIERALGRGLALGSIEEAEALEALLETRGVERAAAWTVATLESRPEKHRPRSIAWCVEVLRDLPPPPPERPAEPVGCAEWATMLATLQEERPRELVEHWLAPLRGRLREGTLELEAPDEFHRAFVADNCTPLLVGLAREVFGGAVAIRFIAAGEAQEAA